MIAGWIYNHLGDRDDVRDQPEPPGSAPKLRFGEVDETFHLAHIATTYTNDGAELWLGTVDVGWDVFYRAQDARKLAWFILWDWWAVSTWFGLKVRLWCWASRKLGKRGILP